MRRHSIWTLAGVLCPLHFAGADALAQPYPLCPGAWDDNGGVSVLDRSRAGITDHSFQIHQTRLEGPADFKLQTVGDFAPQSTSTQTSTAAAPALRLPREFKSLQQHGDLSVRNSVRELQNTVQKLRTPEQRSRAVAALTNEVREEKLDRQLHSSALAEQIRAISTRVQIAGIAEYVDPRTLEAYVGQNPQALSTRDLLQLTSDSGYHTFTLQASALGRLDGNEVKMVGAGEGGRPGGLGAVPPGRKVAWGKNQTGALCLRPAVPPDYKLDPATNRTKRVWDPAGFRDVGMLLWRKRGPNGQAGETEICSFVRLSDNFAVTAAHCAIDSQRGEAIRNRDFTANTIEAIALLPRLDTEDQSPTDCFADAKGCGYIVLPLKTQAELPKGIAWPKGSIVPVPDIALLALPFGGNPAVKSAISQSSVADRLTLVGYGRTNANFDAFESGTLLVGWQSKPPLLEKAELVWSVDIRDGEATGCNGDSGGAVFDGDLSGLPSEQPVLAGIISWGEKPKKQPSDRFEKCTAAPTGHAVRLDSHYSWLCKRSNNAIRGCPGSTLSRR